MNKFKIKTYKAMLWLTSASAASYSACNFLYYAFYFIIAPSAAVFKTN